MRGRGIALAVAGILAGCDLAPVYDPPHTLLPGAYQGSGAFRVAQPERTAATASAVHSLFMA